MQRGVVVLLAAVAVVGWSPAAAQTPVAAPPTVGLEASRPHVGWVSIRLTGPPGLTSAGCWDWGKYQDAELWHCPGELTPNTVRQ